MVSQSLDSRGSVTEVFLSLWGLFLHHGWNSRVVELLLERPRAKSSSSTVVERHGWSKPTFHCKYLLPAQDVWHEVTSDINKQSLDSVDQPIMRRVTSWGRFVSLFTEGGQQFVFCRELSLAGWYFIQKTATGGHKRANWLLKLSRDCLFVYLLPPCQKYRSENNYLQRNLSSREPPRVYFGVILPLFGPCWKLNSCLHVAMWRR